MLELNINVELNNIYIWFCVNKFLFNVEKLNFVIFYVF